MGMEKSYPHICPKLAEKLVPSVIGTLITVSCSSLSTAAVSDSRREWIVWSKIPKKSCLHVRRPTLAFFAAISFSTIVVGILSPVSMWRLSRSRGSGSQHQFSSIWLGASTKSRSTAVPAKRGSTAWLAKLWTPWPLQRSSREKNKIKKGIIRSIQFY